MAAARIAACGVCRTVQIPAVVFVLSRIGVVTARMLVRYFKHALLGCFIVAAIITPTTDFTNMLVIAGPMIVLWRRDRGVVDLREAAGS